MTELRRVQRIWSRIAPIYDARVRLFFRWREPAAEALRAGPGDTVLDLACGTGLNFPHIVRRTGPAGTVIALDCTPAMLERARRRAASRRWHRIEFLLGDAAHLPLADGSCDAVLCTYAMVIIPDYREAVAEAARVVKPGGRVVMLEGKRGSAFWARLFDRLVAFAGRFGGVDLDRRPWEALPALLEDVSRTEYMGGLVYIAGGTKAKEAAGTRAG